MAPKNTGGPEYSKIEAQKAIERVAKSPESGAELAREIKDAHKMVEVALRDVKSPDDEMALRMALNGIKSLETVLAEGGKKRALNEGEKAKLAAVAKELNSKVGSLDFIFDVINFTQDFANRIADRNKLEVSLNAEISRENLSPQFIPIGESLIRSTENLKASCKSYYENLTLQFGAGHIPAEIQAEFNKVNAMVAGLEAKDKIILNSLEFAKLDQSFLHFDKNATLADFENLQRNISSLENKGLIPGLKDLVKARVELLAWNINIKKSVEELKPTNVLKRLEADETLMKSEQYTKEFDSVLSWLVSDVLYAPDKSTLPKNSAFYKGLYDLLARRLERAGSSDVLANGRVMLAQIAVLAAATEHAAIYKSGTEILVYDKSKPSVQDPASYLPAGTAKEMEAARGSWRDSDKYSHFGIIRATDAWKGTVEFDDRGDLFNFDHFEHDSKFEYAFKGADGKIISVNDRVHNSNVADFKQKAETNMRAGEAAILKSSITALNKEVKIVDAHIPKISLLRKLQEEHWVDIDKEGNVTIKCKDNQVEDVYNELMRQFTLEKLYAEKGQLLEIGKRFPEKAKEDHFFEARKIFNQAKIEMASGETYETRGTLVKFLDAMAKVKDARDEDMTQAEAFALETLKGFSKASLERVSAGADDLFGHNEKYKAFLTDLHAMIKDEVVKLGTSKDYKIDIGNLRLGHWRFDASRGTIPKFGSYDMTGLVGLKIPFYEQAKKFADKKVGEIRNNNDYQNWNEAVNEYFDGMYPPVVEIVTWNNLVALENPRNFVELSDASTRKSRFADFADFVRDSQTRRVPRPIVNAKGENDRRWENEGGEIHPELAVSYYRDALGDEVKDAEFALTSVRKKFAHTERSEKKDLYLSQARQQIENELSSAELKSSFASALNISDAELNEAKFDQLRASLTTPEVLNAMAEQLLNRSVDEKMKMQVYKRFYDGKGISGKAKDIWAKINDIEDPFNETWNWSDRTSQKIKNELVVNALIMAASFGVGEIITGGMRGVYLAAGGLRAAEAIESASAAYRLANLGARTVNFTLAEKSIRSVFLKQNTWGTFGSDLSLNLAMFAGIGAGMHFWEKTFGKELVGAADGAKLFETRTHLGFTESPLFQKAGEIGARDLGKQSLGQLGLRGVNWGGRLATETALFTGMGVGQKLSIGEMKWDDINMANEMGTNILTILSMRAGGMLFEPAFKPLVEDVDVRARRMIEDADHSKFLANQGLGKEFFGNAEPAAEQGIMEEVRTFGDRNGLSPAFFAGKSLPEIRGTAKAVADFTAKFERNGMIELPRREDLMGLFKTNKDAFAIVAYKLNELPLSLEDAQAMYKEAPALMSTLANRVPKFGKLFLEMQREKAKLDKNLARELDSGIDASGELVVDSLMETAINGAGGLALAIGMIDGMDHLTLSAVQLLYVTSKLLDTASKGRFLRACGAKMSTTQELEFETTVKAPEEGRETLISSEPSVLDVLASVSARGSRWFIDTIRSAVSKGAEFLKTPNPILKKGENFSNLEPAGEGTENLVFSLDRPGKAHSADSVLEANWKSKSQAQLCDMMAELGVPNEAINHIRLAHSEIDPQLQKYVKVIVVEGQNGEFEPYVLVDQKGMQAEFGMDLAGTEEVLKTAGVVMPGNMAELARYANLPPEFMDLLRGLDREVMVAADPSRMNIPGGFILKFMMWTLPKFILWDTPKFLIKGHGSYLEWAANRKILKGGGAAKGPDGKPVLEAPKPKPEAAKFLPLDEILKGLGVAKLSDNLDAAQIAALTKLHKDLKEGLSNLLYDPEAKATDKMKVGDGTKEIDKNVEIIFKTWIEIAYTELRLQNIHGKTPAATPAAAATPGKAPRDPKAVQEEIDKKFPNGEADTAKGIQGRINALGSKLELDAKSKAFLKGKPKGTKLADLMTELATERDKKDAKGVKFVHSADKRAELQKEIDKIKEVSEKLENIDILEGLKKKRERLDAELKGVSAPEKAGDEQAQLTDKLNKLYESLLSIMTTGAADVNDAVGTHKGMGLRKGLKFVETRVKGKIQTDIAPTATDLTPDEVRTGLGEITDLLKANQANFKRLKELEVATLLGEKKFKLLEPIATANDPTNAQTIGAKAYVDFYNNMVKQRDALRDSTGKIGEKLNRNPVYSWMMKPGNRVRSGIILAVILGLSYAYFNHKPKDKNAPVSVDPVDVKGGIEETHRKNAEERGDDAADFILNQVNQTPQSAPKALPKVDQKANPNLNNNVAPATTPVRPTNNSPSKEEQRRLLGGDK